MVEEVVILKGWMRGGVKRTLDKRSEECATGGTQKEREQQVDAP